MTILVPGRAELYDDTPPLDLEQLEQDYADWYDGKAVPVRAVVIGHITPLAGEVALVRGLRVGDDFRSHNYVTGVPDPITQTAVVQNLKADFEAVAKEDKRRSGIPAAGSTRVYVGSGPEVSTHGDRVPYGNMVAARWLRTWAFAEDKGGTMFSSVPSSRDLFVREAGWCLRSDIDLAFTQFNHGDVVRFTGTDLHKSPRELRIFLQHTLGVEEYQV